MAKTKIEWATDVWNPTVGCTKVSEGCRNCYAERMFERFHPGQKFSEVQWFAERLEQPLHWKEPRRIFVDSMSDLFHVKIPHHFISQVFWIMEMAPLHTFMILTKRPKRMYEWIRDCYPTSLPNVWLGVSVEDQKTADERIPLLLQTPAAVRFVSVEPMLGRIDLWKLATCEETFGSLYDHRGTYPFYQELGWPNKSIKIHDGIDWVICGCETGPYRRPMELDWARSLRDQCQEAGVPFFLKQAEIDGKLVKMPELNGKIWDEMPKNHP